MCNCDCDDDTRRRCGANASIKHSSSCGRMNSSFVHSWVGFSGTPARRLRERACRVKVDPSAIRLATFVRSIIYCKSSAATTAATQSSQCAGSARQSRKVVDDVFSKCPRCLRCVVGFLSRTFVGDFAGMFARALNTHTHTHYIVIMVCTSSRCGSVAKLSRSSRRSCAGLADVRVTFWSRADGQLTVSLYVSLHGVKSVCLL